LCDLVALRPKHIQHLGRLRLTLEERGQSLKVVAAEIDRAVAPLHEAVRLKPDDVEAHAILGRTLFVQGKLDEAIAEIRAVKRLEPNRRMDWVRLITVVGTPIGPKRPEPGKPYKIFRTYLPATTTPDEALSEVEREAGLRAVLKGEALPKDNNERLAFAREAYNRKLTAVATRLWAEALEADPGLANDLRAAHRYNAACAAALAAAGQGEDAAQLDDRERTRLQKQALDWLRADLTLRTKQLESGPPADRAAAQRALLHWQKDPDLAGIRDKEALAKLPAEERAACAKLWADVAALLKKAEEETK
jgi:hypothetical protein